MMALKELLSPKQKQMESAILIIGRPSKDASEEPVPVLISFDILVTLLKF